VLREALQRLWNWRFSKKQKGSSMDILRIHSMLSARIIARTVLQHHSRSLRYRVWCCGLLLAGFAVQAQALTCTSRATGNWSAGAATWTGCGAGGPVAGDTVIIQSPHVVSMDVNNAAASTVTINAGGKLQMDDNSGNNQILTVSGNMTVSGTFQTNPQSGGLHTLNVGGILNTPVGGTVNLDDNPGSVGNGGGCNTTVTGDFTNAGIFAAGVSGANLTVNGNLINTGTFNGGSGASLITFGGNLTSNLPGTFTANTANVDFNRNGNQVMSGTSTTYSFNTISVSMGATNANILDMQSNYTAPAGFLTINSGTFKHSNTSNITPWIVSRTIPANGGFWLNGAATVSSTGGNISVAGLLRVSAGTFNLGSANNNNLLPNAATAVVTVDGGLLSIAGRLQSASNYAQNISAGTLLVGRVGNTTGGASPFQMTSGTLTWSGGTVIVQRAGAGGLGFLRTGGTNAVTGGTLQVGNASTPAGNTMQINSTAPVWNLIVLNGVGATTAQLQTNSLTVLNDVTINTSSTLNANGLNLTVGGGNAGGNWTNNNTFTPGAGTVTLTGTFATPTLSGTAATTFNNLIINKAIGNVTINCGTPSPTVNGTLTLTAGKIITSGVSPGCAATCSTQVPIILSTTGITAGGGNTSYIQGALQKNYAAGVLTFGSIEFPIGDASNYAPISLNAGTTTTAGRLAACTTGNAHPNITNPPMATQGIDAAKDLNRYWSFFSCGLNTAAAPVNATFTYKSGNPVDVPVGVTPANFILQTWNGSIWNPSTLVSAVSPTIQVSNIDVTSAACPGTVISAWNLFDIGVGEPFAGITPRPGDFNAFDTTTTTGAIIGMIQTKQAGVAFSVRLARRNATDNVLDSTYNQTGVNVELLDVSDLAAPAPAIATGCSTIGPAAGNWHVIAGTTQTVTFASGIATAIFTGATMPTNSFKKVRVHIVKAGAGVGEGCSTDLFAIRPTSITITAFDSNWQVAGTARALTGASANATSGNAVHAASTLAATTPRPFTLRASPQPSTATNYDGSPTTNSSYPKCGTLCATGPGTLGFTAGSWTSAGSGVRENATANYSEAGTFNLQLEDAGYASVDSVDGSSAATLTIPTTLISGIRDVEIGRFVPDHFIVATTPGNTPAFKTFNSVNSACASRSFTYIGQQFGYSIAPIASVKAQNAENTTTANYRGGLWKIAIPDTVAKDCTTSPDICTVTLSQASATSVSSVTQVYTYSTSPSFTPNWDSSQAFFSFPKVVDNSDGTGTVIGNLADLLAFKRKMTPPAQAKFTASINLTESVTDNSEIGFAGNGTISTTSSATFSNIAFDVSNEFLFGRLKLPSAHGSELLVLPVPIETQYWNGAVFVTNTFDNCTTIQSANISLSQLPVGCTSVSSNLAFTSGTGNLKLLKPGAKCRADMTVNLTAEGKTYLQGGASFNTDPTARATFGVYKGGPVIYMREMY
jgi:hypothetical protein